MRPCVAEKFSLCDPRPDPAEALRLGLEVAEGLGASPYEAVGLLVAFGADPAEAKRRLGLTVTGSVGRPVQTFHWSFGRRLGYEKVERGLLRLYGAQRGDCLCPVGTVAPVEGGYIAQRPYGIYLCRGECVEVAPEPLQVYDHPAGCMLYDPPMPLPGQPLAAVASALKRLKVSEPELVASLLLPGLCRDLLGVRL